MARFAYDVNTRTRLIDVHKQFNGGLKTVDTDDALGAVYLRQAENVSLSEFGFIEKRYGTYKNFSIENGVTSNSKLQGFWEFNPENALYQIMAIDGHFYVNGVKVTTYYTEEDLRYPDFANKFSWTNNNNAVALTWTDVSFQATKEISGVIKNDVMYFFTGTYPVYAAEFTENNITQLRFYLLPIQIPTYDEIVVTGHNLLENDYENAYGYDSEKTYSPNGLSSGTIDTFLQVREVDGVLQKNFTPKIPYAQEGFINFNFQYVIDEDNILYDFRPTSTLNAYLKYRKVDLDSIKFRTSGAGASNSDFINADKTATNFIPKTNYEGTSDVLLRTSEFYLDRTPISSSEISDSVTLPFILFPDQRRRRLTIETDYEPFEITRVNAGDTFEFTISQETGNSSDPYENVLLPSDLTEYQTFLGMTVNTSKVGSFNTSVSISIVPFDNERDYSEEEVIITDANIEKSSSDTYRFVIPESLEVNTSIIGYKIKFTYNLNTIYIDATDTAGMNDAFPSLYKQINRMEKMEDTSSENYLSNYPDLGFKFTNLISGTYDFELTYSLTIFELENGILQEIEKQYSSVYFYNVTITTEKLQDYSGSEGVPTKLEALWECNRVIEHFNKLMVWGSTKMPNSVFYTFPDRPTYFPSKFYLDFGSEASDPVMAVTPYMNILAVQTINTTWGVRGNSGLIDAPAPYVPFGINSTVGTIAPNSVRPVRNHLFFLSKQGVIALKSLYAADEQYNIDFVDRNIRNIVPQDSEAVGIQFDNQYWLNFPKNGITLRWYIDKKAWVQDKFGGYVNSEDVHITSTYGWDQMNGVFKWQIADGKLEFITHPSRLENTENLRIYKIGVDYSLPTDLGKNVFTKLETSFLNQNYPFHHKNYKEAKLDFTIQNEYNRSRDAVYTMNTNEDVFNNSIHTMDNVSLVKNHRYRIVYNFSETTESDEVGALSFTSEAIPDVVNGGTFEETDYDIIGSLLFRILSLQDLQVTEIRIKDRDGNTTLLSSTDGGFTITELSDFDEYVDFLLPNFINGIVDIEVVGDFAGFNSGATLYDTTYDDNLSIDTWVVSEGQTLNLDNIESYDQAKARLDVDFTGRLGTWIFGSSDFGNKVTAVKTIKLSGKGYNAKVYLEDSTKSKWTLESMGITYKMKRARSR